MLDKFNRKINYLRVSVTDKCNLRCLYCMPESGIKLIPHEEVLSFEEIENIIKTGIDLGIEKVRLTGGEPLVRRGIVDLVKMIFEIKGIKDFAMTTNGTLLKMFAKDLFYAGLKRINISLDAINPEEYQKITRCGNVSQAIEGIFYAKEIGFDPIKINCVINESPEEKNAVEVKQFAMKNNFEIRFIKKMDLSTGKFSKVIGESTGGNCFVCNRIRVSSNGNIYPCLFNDISYSIRKYGIKAAMELAVNNKPEAGGKTIKKEFYNIGG